MWHRVVREAEDHTVEGLRWHVIDSIRFNQLDIVPVAAVAKRARPRQHSRRNVDPINAALWPDGFTQVRQVSAGPTSDFEYVVACSQVETSDSLLAEAGRLK